MLFTEAASCGTAITQRSTITVSTHIRVRTRLMISIFLSEEFGMRRRSLRARARTGTLKTKAIKSPYRTGASRFRQHFKKTATYFRLLKATNKITPNATRPNCFLYALSMKVLFSNCTAGKGNACGWYLSIILTKIYVNSKYRGLNYLFTVCIYISHALIEQLRASALSLL